MQIAIALGLSQTKVITILGSATVGSVLSLSSIALTGSSPITYQIQWFRNGTIIPGATSASYTPLAADIGSSISAQLTLPGGSVLTSSNAVTVQDNPGALPTGLTLEDFTRDRAVFDTGAAFGLSSAGVARSGTADPGEVVQLRVVTDAGVQVVGWTDAATADGAGDWTGIIFAPRGSAALRIEARLKRNAAVTAATVNRFFAGHAVAFWGQSEWHRSVLTGFSSPGFTEPVADPNALTVAYSDNTGVGYGTGLVYSAVTDATPVSSHMTALSNALSIMRPGERFLVVFQTCSGTGLSSTLDETDGGRDWSQDLAVHNFAFADGNWPGLATQSWYSADASMDGGLIDLILQACGNVTFAGAPWTEASSAVYEHDFSEIYTYTRTKWSISPPHRFESASSGPHMAAMRTRLREVFALPHLPAHMSLGIEMLNYRNGDTGGSDSAHPNTGGIADDGMHQVMRLTAAEFCRGLGLLAITQPEFTNAALDPARQYVEVWSSAGAITTERAARSEAVPGGYPAVDGFKINGVKATDTSLVAGRVRVNWAVQDGDILTFGDDGCGSDGDDVALVADLWKQWPIVATAGLHPKVHGLPVRGLTPSSVLGVIPAVSLPADPNTHPNLAAPSNFVNAAPVVTGQGGWSAPSAWTFDGAGKLRVGPNANVVATGTLPWTIRNLPTLLAGAAAELSFVITSPDAASGSVNIVVSKQGGGGGVTLYSGPVTIAHNTLVTLPLGVITATNSRLEVTFMRTTPVVGTLEIQRLTVKAV